MKFAGLILLMVFSSLIFIGCPDNEVIIADCTDGWHPCNDDQSECCPDTTSHDFIWEIHSLGNSWSVINDIEIVDENDIWVVGWISIIETDSSYTGSRRNNYNLAHWNGLDWSFELVLGPFELYNIDFISENNI